MSATRDAGLRLDTVVKRFGDGVEALRGVSLEVAAGEILALLGPSGCGKTSTLRVLAGFDRADAGCVAVRGVLVDGPGVFVPPEARGVGFVFQDYALFPHLTVRQNVAFGLRKLDATARRRRLEQTIALCDLHGLENRFPHELSGGQQQRTALARALAPNHGIVLLDEPLSNLDPNGRELLRGRLRALLREAAVTAVLVTHDRDEAFEVAERIAVMRDGRIEQVGTPETLYEAPASVFVARFVGDANILPAVRRAGTIETEAGRAPGAFVADSGDALVAIVRPRHLSIQAQANGTAVVQRRIYREGRWWAEVRLASGGTVLGTTDGPVVEGARVALRIETGRTAPAASLPGAPARV